MSVEDKTIIYGTEDLLTSLCHFSHAGSECRDQTKIHYSAMVTQRITKIGFETRYWLLRFV